MKEKVSRSPLPRHIEPNNAPEYQMTEKGLIISRAPGSHQRVRCFLADVAECDNESQQKAMLQKFPSYQRRKMIDWLTRHTPTEGDVTIKNIFQQLIVIIDQTQKSDSHTSRNIFQRYDATSAEEQDKRQQRKEKAEGYFWLKVPWVRNELQTLGLHTILNSPEVQVLYPVSSEQDKVKVSYSLSVPNGILLQNYGKVSEDPDLHNDLPPIVPPPEQCVCQQYKTESSIDFHGHVATVDPDFIVNKRLRSYWLKGRKYRCQAHPQVLMANFEKSLDNYISVAARRNKLDACVFDEWRNKLLQCLLSKCEVMFRDADAPYHPFLSQDGMNELKTIHNDMVITYADKSSHDFVLCCKNVYKHELWMEIHSPHYEDVMQDNESIWAEHAKLSLQVNQNQVNAHRYLYGILKMHKNPVGMRWIAGNHMQEVEQKKKSYPACSLSGAEMALGGILRMCMHNLEKKDFGCRRKGYKRYWVVTNVDRVAADIKYNVDILRGKPIFTRDFTRMYTSIPQGTLVEKVQTAVQEVFDWHSAKTKTPRDQLRVHVTYPKPNKAHACFSDKGFSFTEVVDLLSKVCFEVYFQQGNEGSVRRQTRGLPMGGKASAELANLYCYAIESQFIDNLIQQGKIEEAKSWYYTWRYIDDLLGFGDRGDFWKQIPYGMEHVDTTDTAFSERTKEGQAVFLGMRVLSNPAGVWTSVQPKGEGWMWLPRKFIEYSSCHTHYTKWYMFKGLLIRALTICNNQEDFFRAVVHYAQGLVSRGFPASSLLKAWRKFAFEKLSNPLARRTLTTQFKEWLSKQNFDAAHPNEQAQQQTRYEKAKAQFTGTLMCGLVAVNHILKARHKPCLTARYMQEMAEAMAQKECALLYSCQPNTVFDLATDPRGNYAADTLLNVLETHVGLVCRRWIPLCSVTSDILLVGSGQHWQAIIKDKEEKWYIMEKYTNFAVQDIQVLLFNRSKTGAVYQLEEQTVATMSTDTNLRKRLREEIPLSQTPNPTSPTGIPTDKRLQLWDKRYPRPDSFTIGPNPTRMPHQPNSQTPHIPIELPADFQAAPGFHFQPNVEEMKTLGSPSSETESWNFPRQDLPENEGLDALLEAMTSPTQVGSQKVVAEQSPSRPQSLLQRFNDVVNMVISPLKSPPPKSEVDERPKRNVAKPHLYQSEEEAEKEKGMRKK